MPEYIGGKETALDKIMFGLFIGAMALLFIVLTQPVWRGEEMKAEFISDCEKVGGVLLTHEKMFSTSYECAERLDR